MYKKYTRELGIHEPLYHKILLIMRLTTVMLLSFLLQTRASTFAQRITINQQKIPIETILKEIRKQSGYSFVYDGKAFNETQEVSIAVKNVSVEEAVKTICNGLDLTYEIDGKIISIKKKEASSLLENFLARLKAIDISGKITDSETGKPIARATIGLRLSNRSVISDEMGLFKFSNLPDNAVLVFSSVGYQTKELKVTGNNISVSMLQSISVLNETLVIGYGTTTKRLNTGSVASITAKDIEKQPVENILLAMQGRIPGMQITSKSGLAGSAPTVQIRGNNSLASGSSPLFMLDGVAVPEAQNPIVGATLDNTRISLLLGINPSEIERVDVLKDADATSIYGSRGANGVVLITTKHGEKGKLKIGVNAYTGFQNIPHFIDMLSTQQYNTVRREALRNDGIIPTAANSPDLFAWDTTSNHNWQREFLGKTSITQDFNVSASGGNLNTTFYINGGYHNEGSIMPGNSDVNRKSFRANLSHLSTDRKFSLDISSSTAFSYMNTVLNSLVTSINLPPDYPLYNANGSPNFTGPRSFPLAGNLQPYSNPTKYYNGDIKIGYAPIAGLRFSVNAGYSNNNSEQQVEQPIASLNPTFNNGGQLRILNSSFNTWVIEPQGEYKVNILEHHFALLAGGTLQRTTNENLTITGTNFINDALIGDIGSAATQSTSASNSQYSYASFFSRLTYDYKQKYLVNISFRRDGSSRFGPDKRFGNFGAVGLGWIFVEEPWLKSALPFISFGKLRSSYGVSGNDQIADYGYLSTYASNTGSFAYNGPTLIAARLANADFRWEQTYKFEAALELGFLQDRLLLTSSFFRNRSGNQLISYALSPQTGFNSYQANFPAIVQNQGWEIELTSDNIHTKDFDWKTTLNFSKSENILAKYDNIKNSPYSSVYAVGQSLNLYQSYHYEGLNASGVPIITDRNNDGTINYKDAVPSGNNDPFFGGMSNNVSFKNFNFSFFLQYSRFSSLSLLLPTTVVGGIGVDQTPFVLNRWQNPGDEQVTNIPKFTSLSSTYSARILAQSDQFIETMNIFRLSNIALSYNLPSPILKFVKMSKCQIYMNGQNLFVWDKYKNLELDPLTGNTAVPPLRTLTFGINCTF